MRSPSKAGSPYTVEESLEILDSMVTAGKLDGRCVEQLRSQLDEVAAIRAAHLDEDESAFSSA